MTDTQAKKRIVPRSDGKITRIDVRFPNELLEEIEALATANGAPINHISGKPTLTPTILDLIRVGLDHYSPEAIERIQAKTESVKIASDTSPDLSAIKDELLTQLRGELEALVAGK